MTGAAAMAGGGSRPGVAPVERAELVTEDPAVRNNTLPEPTIEPTIEDRHDAHPATLRQAVAFVDDNAHLDVTVADIAAAASVTIRAVQLAFQRYLGITPMEYLRQVRLDHAHRELLAADPRHETVTAVAYRWGFRNSSRFAAAYRRAYGVTPSHTLYHD